MKKVTAKDVTRLLRRIAFGILPIVMAAAHATSAAEVEALTAGSEFAAKDSLAPAADESEDATKCVNGLTWTPEKFSVTLEQAVTDHGDWLVRFPSPVVIGLLRIGGSFLNPSCHLSLTSACPNELSRDSPWPRPARDVRQQGLWSPSDSLPGCRATKLDCVLARS